MRTVARTVWSLDLWLSLVGGLLVLVVLLVTDRQLENASWVAGYAFSAGVALAGVNIVSMRWVSDRAKGSHYGEVLRYLDPDESSVTLPYWVVIAASVGLSVVGVAGFLVDGELSRGWMAAYFSILMTLVLYGLLGTISLLRLTRWHQRQSGLLQAAEEEAARRERESRGDGASSS